MVNYLLCSAESGLSGNAGRMGRRPLPERPVILTLSLSPAVVRKLDAISASIDGNPNRQALIRTAIREFLESREPSDSESGDDE